MYEDSHINLPIHWAFVEPVKRAYSLPENVGYTIERWDDGRLCKQPLNCLSNSFFENKLRGGKNV